MRLTIVVLVTGVMAIPWTVDAAQWRYQGGGTAPEDVQAGATDIGAPTATRTSGRSAAMPRNNMTKKAVREKYGEPQEEIPAVGEPPISRWRYPGYTVYFERDRVITAVSNEVAPLQ